jgi:hypothetical protein
MAPTVLLRQRTLILGPVLLACVTATTAAQFNLYPRAKSDEWTAKAMVEAKAALPPGINTEVVPRE